MKKPPEVSVLMTAFNREKFISEAIESVLSSTFKDFELIIVDDCSSDRTLEIARSYKLIDKRVKVYVNDNNLGDYPNRNIAASYAVGKYLKYLDSDDTMSHICLERMVNEMNKNPHCAFGITSRNLKFVTIHYPENSFRTHFFERGILDVSPSATIIRKDVFFYQGGFSGIRCVSDFEFWLRIALSYPLIEMEKDLVYWRQHDEQEINLISHLFQTLEYTLPIIKDKLEICQLSDAEKKKILVKYKKNTMRSLIKNWNIIGLRKIFYYKRINNLKLSDAF
jgi:glycosyltransferase involved in cell wall biosynthesis